MKTRFFFFFQCNRCGTRFARLIQSKVCGGGHGARQFAPPYGAGQE